MRCRFRQRLCGVRGAQGCSRLWISAPSSRARASASLNAGFLLGVGPVPLVSEPGYVPSGGRVVPAESAILPSEVQVQDRAVALVSPVVNPFYGDGLVDPVNQPVAGQGRPVVPAPRVVKTPVFRDAQGGVAIPLYGDFPPSPVLDEAISRTKSGGLPCSEVT